MVVAKLGDQVIASSDNTVVVEGNHYFPVDDVRTQFLKESDMHTTCFWKGEASYYHVEAGGKLAENAAFYYPTPSDKASMIKDHIAFWQEVEVTED